MPNDPNISPVCVPDDHGHCSICADEGLVARVLSIEAGATARVLIGGEEQVVALDLMDGVRSGDAILVHLGFAIASLERS